MLRIFKDKPHCKAKIMRPTNKKVLYTLFVIAVLLRVTLLMIIYPDQEVIMRSDGCLYHTLAKNLSLHSAFSVSESFPFEPTTLRAPVYPLFLATIYKFVGPRPFPALILQAVISMTIIFLTYKMGKKLFNPTIGLIGAGLIAIDPGSILHSNQICTEAVYVILLLAFMYWLFNLLESKRTKYAVFSGTLLGIATLCRPDIQYLPVFFIVPLVILWRRDSPRIKQYIVLIVSFIVTIAPWSARNYILFRSTQLTSVPEYTLLFWNVAHLRAWTEHITFKEAQEQIFGEVKREFSGKELNPIEQAKFYRRKSLEEISANPRGYAIVHSLGALPVLFGTHSDDIISILGLPDPDIPEEILSRLGHRGKRLVEMLGLPVAPRDETRIGERQFITDLSVYAVVSLERMALFASYLLCVYALYRSRGKRELRFLLLFLLLGVYILVVGGPGGRGRYRVPLMPYIYLAGTYGFASYIDRRRQRR